VVWSQTRRRAGVLLATLIGATCGGDSQPVAPGGTASPATPSAPYTISGVVTEYHGGPLEGMSVDVTGSPGGAVVRSKTDAQGRYSVLGPKASYVAVTVGSPPQAGGRFPAQSRFGVPASDQTIDFVLHRDWSLYANGSSVTGTIHGDEIFADGRFLDRCTSVACVVVEVDCCASDRGIDLTLSWDDPSRALVLYLPADYTSSGAPATRVCCGSPLSTIYYLNEDVDAVAIGFEAVRGAPPAPNDSQTFRLTATARQ